VSGRLKPPHLAVRRWVDLFQIDSPAQELAQAWYFSGLPPSPVDIPWTWIQGPLRIRQDNPLRRAEVSQSGGSTARAKDATLTTTEQMWTYTQTIDSITAADAANLARWTVEYYTQPRPRTPALTLLLNDRSEDELYRILSVRQGTRISLSGMPASWPTGAGELIVEGITHTITADLRRVSWNTTPVIGAELGESGPWLYTDDTLTDSTYVPY
jgi:hypothetical protein